MLKWNQTCDEPKEEHICTNSFQTGVFWDLTQTSMVILYVWPIASSAGKSFLPLVEDSSICPPLSRGSGHGARGSPDLFPQSPPAGANQDSLETWSCRLQAVFSEEERARNDLTRRPGWLLNPLKMAPLDVGSKCPLRVPLAELCSLSPKNRCGDAFAFKSLLIHNTPVDAQAAGLSPV